jgi:CheY-like chemotaxis protein
MLRQVLMIFLLNSVKYTFEGKIKIDIYKEGNYLLFHIWDSGVGIEEAHLKQFFQPLLIQGILKGDTSMGLNVYLSYKLIKLLGGDITIVSKKNQYTSVMIKLPYNKCDTISINNSISILPNIQQECKSSNEGSQQNDIQKILIVDDNAANIFAISSFLKKMGYCYDSAFNGRQAVECVKKTHYRVIFMDVNMPIMDGLEATKQIRLLNTALQRPKQFIYALTAQMEGSIMEQIDKCGFDGKYSKPVCFKFVESLLLKVCSA